jgi:hypothetical protein
MLHEPRKVLELKAAIRDDRPRRPRRGNWMRLLGQVLKLAGGHGELLRHDERPWASVTFSGTRHTIALAFEGADAVAAAEIVIDRLADHEFDVPGHIVADAQVREVTQTFSPSHKMLVEMEILLLEDL